MDNTGYKVATKIKVAKKSGDSISEKTYPIGRYNGDNFVSYSSHELAQLSPEEYKKCVQDTKLYILTEEEMENMGDFLNENMVQDFGMCPLPLPVDMISASGEVDSNNYIWVTFTSQYEVASDILIKMMYEDSIVPNEILLLKGHKTVTAQQHPNRGGTEAMLDLNVKGSLLKEDSTYRYSIQPMVLIPRLNIIDNKFTPVIRVYENKVQLTYMCRDVDIQVSDIVIRVSINENGVESYFDITKIAGDGTTNMYDVPEKFWGKTANVKIYSVDGIVGKDTDSRYHYVVDPTVEIPNRKVMTENKLSATVSVKSGEIYLTIRSKYPVDSDLMISLEDTYPYYPQINKGEDEVVVKMRTSSYGKTLWGNIYSVNGVFGMYYDDKYRYVFEQNISIPSDPFIDNTPGYDFINKNGSLVVAVDFPNPVDNNVDFYFRGLSDESTHTCSSGEKHKEFEVSPLDYGKRIQLMIISVGGNDKVYGDYLRGDKYKYKDLGEKKVVPSI